MIEKINTFSHLLKTQDLGNESPRLTDSSDSDLKISVCGCAEKSRTRFSAFDLTTHNLLKILRREIRVSSVLNFTKKSASPAGVPRGFVCAEILWGHEAIQPPWKTKSLARFSFINPLRYAPIANATTGLIQAKILHSCSLSFWGWK